MFTEFKFSPVQISDAAVATAKALLASNPGANPAQFAADAIAERLTAKPAQFLQYGPYWWAVKTALRLLGHDFGQTDDAAMRREYGGALPTYAALVAGEQFREFYNATYLARTEQFWLDDQAEQSYVLFDSDMEIRRLGGKNPLRVAADMGAQVVEDDAVLDSAAAPAPVAGGAYAVPFEHEAKLWNATVYAADRAGAEGMVKRFMAGGRIGRAIEASKDAYGLLLDSADPAQPLLIDLADRRVCEMAPTGGLS